MSNYIIPPIGASGKFEFKDPFSSQMKKDQEYKVTAIRSLKEILDSGEDPLEHIYKPVGLSQTDLNKDLEDNVPMVVLSSGSSNYTYIPANKLASLPNIIGVKYQQKMLAINIGYLPLDYNLDLAKETIKETVLEVLGIESTTEAISTSAIKYVEKDEHEKFMKLIDGKKTNNMSYRTKYKILLETHNKVLQKLKELEECAIQHLG